jgi:intracellular multiplication protein IcmO
MATEIKHVKERIIKPDREDIRFLIRENSEIRFFIYCFIIVTIICIIIIQFSQNGEQNNNLAYIVRTLSIIIGGALVGIFFGRLRDDEKADKTESVIQNLPNKKYLLSLGLQVKKFYGNAGKTLKVPKNKVRNLLFNAETLKRHMLIMATVGAGKTVLMKGMLEQHLTIGGGALVVDGKGTAEFAKEIYGLCVLLGREDDFVHINFLDMNNTHTVNPLLYGNAIALYEMLIALLVGEEDIWKAKTKEYMKNVLKLLVYKRDYEGLKLDFDSVAEYLTLERLSEEAVVYRNLTYGFAELADFVQYVSSSIGIDYQRFLRDPQDTLLDEMREKIAKGQEGGQGIYDASVAIQSWRDVLVTLKSDYGRVFNTQTPTISMFEAVQRNKLVFVTLPTMSSDTTPRNLGRLILGLVKNVAAEKAEKSLEPEIPFLMLLDEVGSYIIEGFGRLMSKSRALGISVIPIFQSFAQIDAVGKTLGSEGLERREMIDVTGTHIIMKTIHPEVTEFYAKMIEEVETVEAKYVEKRDFVKGSIGTEDNFESKKDPAIKHKEIQNLNAGEMIVITDGKVYRSTAVTESCFSKYGKKITFEGKKMETPIPLTQYIPKQQFLAEAAKIYQNTTI